MGLVAADNTYPADKEDIVAAAVVPSCPAVDPMDNAVPYHCSCQVEETAGPFQVAVGPYLAVENAT